MAKGQHLSRHQQGIVRRYYQHLDTLAVQKLAELVSELYLATDEKKRQKLWAEAAAHLPKLDADQGRVRRVLEARDVAGLAALVNEAAAVRPKPR
jgi:hypothetical protein